MDDETIDFTKEMIDEILAEDPESICPHIKEKVQLAVRLKMLGIRGNEMVQVLKQVGSNN